MHTDGAAPEVPVYLIHWNSPDTAADSVRSLLASEGVRARIVIVDNGSEPSELARLEAALPPGVEILRLGANRGYCGAANAAVSAWRTTAPGPDDLFAVAAHDVIVKPDCLRRLADAAAAHPSYGVLGPVRWDDDWRRVDMAGGYWDVRRAAWWRTEVDHGVEVAEVDWVSGALMVVRGACLDALRGYDERLFAYYEDVDVCLRARDAGWQVGVVPLAAAHETTCTVASWRLHYLLTRNGLLLVRARGGRRPAWRLAARAYRLALRAAVGAALPLRGRERRRESRGKCIGLLRGATAALLDRGFAATPPVVGDGRAPAREEAEV